MKVNVFEMGCVDGSPPTTRRKFSTNTCAQETSIRDIDYWRHPQLFSIKGKDNFVSANMTAENLRLISSITQYEKSALVVQGMGLDFTRWFSL